MCSSRECRSRRRFGAVWVCVTSKRFIFKIGNDSRADYDVSICSKCGAAAPTRRLQRTLLQAKYPTKPIYAVEDWLREHLDDAMATGAVTWALQMNACSRTSRI